MAENERQWVVIKTMTEPESTFEYFQSSALKRFVPDTVLYQLRTKFQGCPYGSASKGLDCFFGKEFKYKAKSAKERKNAKKPLDK